MVVFPIGELRSFEDFSEIMGNFPYLKQIDERRRNRLLRELYQIALNKRIMEGIGKALREDFPKVRRARRHTLKAMGLLREALQSVGEARASCNEALAACEEKSRTAGKSFTFAVMEKNLNFSVAALEEHTAELAARIHPKLRTNAEKRVGTKFMAFKDSALAKAHNLPSGEKALALDAWFMHRAAACIDRYKGPTKGKDIIIAKLFDAAFKGFRSQASVQKALKGRRKREPQYSPPIDIVVVSPDERFNATGRVILECVNGMAVLKGQ